LLNQNSENLKLSSISSQAYSEEQECHELNLCLSFQHITYLLQKLKNITSLSYVKYSLQRDESLQILIIQSDEARIVE